VALGRDPADKIRSYEDWSIDAHVRKLVTPREDVVMNEDVARPNVMEAAGDVLARRF
jgi:hypothetical protein